MTESHRRTVLFLSVVLLMFLLASCSARRSEPLFGALRSSPQIADGQKIFMTYCYQCHPGGEAGLAPALNNKWLPAFAVRFQVRQGFGAMPAFTTSDISDVELDAVLAYLHALRSKK